MIHNKDGSTYQLSYPNKLTSTQAFFDRSEIVLHNCHWDDVVAAEEDNLVPVKSDFSVKYQEKLKRVAEALAEEYSAKTVIETEIPIVDGGGAGTQPKVEEIKDESPPNIESEFNVDENDEEIPKLDYTVLFHCLPAKITQHRDDLYGESFARLQYGKKFIFPGVVVSSGDLGITFWTTDPRNQVTEKSVIYPYRYENGIPYDDYRWWRVVSKSDKDGGYLFEAIISDFQPDFS